MDKNKWPYPHIDEMYNSENHAWHETNKRIYWDQLGCVPPARMEANAFMVGEAWKHDEMGASIRAVYCVVSGRYFCKNDKTVNFNPEVYIQEIKNQFSI